MIILACTKMSQEVVRERYPGTYGVAKKGDLDGLRTLDRVYSIHWHWKIPDIFLSNNVIGFHMTDLPWGGGSYAYERLMKEGFTETMVTAFEVVSEYDAGPILMKRHIEITDHKGETMWRVYHKCCDMIEVLEKGNPMYIKQGVF